MTFNVRSTWKFWLVLFLVSAMAAHLLIRANQSDEQLNSMKKVLLSLEDSNAKLQRSMLHLEMVGSMRSPFDQALPSAGNDGSSSASSGFYKKLSPGNRVNAVSEASIEEHRQVSSQRLAEMRAPLESLGAPASVGSVNPQPGSLSEMFAKARSQSK